MAVDISALPDEAVNAVLTLRVPEELAADAEGFMGGWWCVRQAADVLTLLTSRLDGDQSLLRRYEPIDFFTPVYSGEYLRFTGKLVAVGNTSRTYEIVGERIIKDGPGSQADIVDPPEKVFFARAIAVVPADKQRNRLPQLEG